MRSAVAPAVVAWNGTVCDCSCARAAQQLKKSTAATHVSRHERPMAHGEPGGYAVKDKRYSRGAPVPRLPDLLRAASTHTSPLKQPGALSAAVGMARAV